jgi:hypothetical protein
VLQDQDQVVIQILDLVMVPHQAQELDSMMVQELDLVIVPLQDLVMVPLQDLVMAQELDLMDLVMDLLQDLVKQIKAHGRESWTTSTTNLSLVVISLQLKLLRPSWDG